MRVCIQTFGCRTNLSDSSELARALLAAGYQLVREPVAADIVLVNSCTVTSAADRDAGKALRRARRAAPHAHLVLAGCLPVAYPEHDVCRFADSVIAGNDWNLVVKTLGPSPLLQPGAGAQPQSNLARDFPFENLLNLSRANIKIGQGCDQGCAYCVVPSARGKPASRLLEDVLGQFKQARMAGFQEVVLTATHVARYGEDRPGAPDLAGLMQAVESEAGNCRVRLSSLEPDARLFVALDRMQKSDVWCRHVHVALQHASDTVLQRMGRPYRFQDAAKFISEAHSLIRGIGIGMDVIVGFPGETEEEFQELVAALDTVPFSYLHVFAYSPRPGTRASLGHPVGAQLVKERSSRLRQLAASKKEAFAASMVGARLDVLVEKRREPQQGRLMGLTDNYMRVYMDGTDEWKGRLIPANVVSVEGATLLCSAAREGG